MTITRSTPTTTRSTPKPRWYARPWIGPLAVLTLAFLAFSLPPYLTLDPAQARIPPREEYAWFYPALVTHIFCGSVALLTACLQIWPWLRRRLPLVHRWSGRVYVFAGVLPAGLLVLTITPLGTFGANQRVANTMLGVLWLATTIAGYRAVRKRHYAGHREWMIRSIALAFSIITNRLWGALCVILLAPGAEVGSAAFAQAAGVSTWLSWVVNLLIAEWWLQRTRRRRTTRATPAESRHR